MEKSTLSSHDLELRIDDEEEPGPLMKELTKKIEYVLLKHGLTQFSSRIVIHYLQVEGGKQRMFHAVNYILGFLNVKNGRKIVVDNDLACLKNWQSGCPNIIRGLRARPFWDSNDFPWLRDLENASVDILEELMSLKSMGGAQSSGFQPYRSPIKEATAPSSSSTLPTTENEFLPGEVATDTGDWNVFYLYLHGLNFDENLEKCPTTAAAIRAIPRHYNHAFFSAISPGTHIKSHYGPTNKKLRIQLPLRVPTRTPTNSDEGTGSSNRDDGGNISSHSSSCWLRAADQKVYLEEGKAIVFDDSFEHEAANDHPSEPRVVLVVDFWHPDLSNEEVKFFEFINRAQVAAAHRLADRMKVNKELRNRGKDRSPGSEEPSIGDEDDGDLDKYNEEEEEEEQSFLTIIQRVRAAAVHVSEESIWGPTTAADSGRAESTTTPASVISTSSSTAALVVDD